MYGFDKDDIPRLVHSIRLFLGKAGVLTEMSAMPVLYLELPTIELMHQLRLELTRAMSLDLAVNTREAVWTEVDDFTIRMTPYAGVSIVLSCKQRFVTRRGVASYNTVQFVKYPLRPPGMTRSDDDSF